MATKVDPHSPMMRNGTKIPVTVRTVGPTAHPMPSSSVLPSLLPPPEVVGGPDRLRKRLKKANLVASAPEPLPPTRSGPPPEDRLAGANTARSTSLASERNRVSHSIPQPHLSLPPLSLSLFLSLPLSHSSFPKWHSYGGWGVQTTLMTFL